MWPEPTPLRDKLYGNLEELRRTALGGHRHLRLAYEEDEEGGGKKVKI